MPPEYAGRTDAYVHWMCSHIMPRIRRHRLAVFADIHYERGAFTFEQVRRYLSAARDLGFLLKMHAEQFAHSGAVRLAVEMGTVSADHLEYIDDEDVRLLGRSDTIATLLPGAVFHLGLDRYPPARPLIEAGAAVALATDFNPGTCPTCNMQIVMSLACSQMRMTPAEAFVAATINGAHALRLGRRVGSIETGKRADLVMFDASDYREISYQFGVNLVAMTMKNGRVLYRKENKTWEDD